MRQWTGWAPVALGLGLALALAGCGGAVPEVARYAGPLPGCGLSASTLVRQGGQFSFTPGDGVLTIAGDVAGDGGYAGALNTQAPHKTPFILHVQGKAEAEQASVDYEAPNCRTSGTLPRVRQPLL